MGTPSEVVAKTCLTVLHVTSLTPLLYIYILVLPIHKKGGAVMVMILWYLCSQCLSPLKVISSNLTRYNIV